MLAPLRANLPLGLVLGTTALLVYHRLAIHPVSYQEIFLASHLTATILVPNPPEKQLVDDLRYHGQLGPKLVHRPYYISVSGRMYQ